MSIDAVIKSLPPVFVQIIELLQNRDLVNVLHLTIQAGEDFRQTK